jgi:hypothetical protein
LLHPIALDSGYNHGADEPCQSHEACEAVSLILFRHADDISFEVLCAACDNSQLLKDYLQEVLMHQVLLLMSREKLDLDDNVHPLHIDDLIHDMFWDPVCFSLIEVLPCLFSQCFLSL